MIRRVSGILQKIHSFLHGLFSPPPADDDDMPFLDDLGWLQETERIRQDALLFWSESSLNRYGSISELSAPGRFYEKHTTSLSEFDLMTLNAMAAVPAETQSKDVIFEPARPASPERTPVEGGTDPAPVQSQPVMSFIDPLEDLYEPVATGFVPVWEKSAHPYTDLYSVILQMSSGKKRRD